MAVCVHNIQDVISLEFLFNLLEDRTHDTGRTLGVYDDKSFLPSYGRDIDIQAIQNDHPLAYSMNLDGRVRLILTGCGV